MAKRRQAVRGHEIGRKKNNKRLNQLADFAVVLWKPKLILMAFLFVLVSTVYTNIDVDEILPIASVKIEGEFNYLDKEQLRKQTLPALNGGFFSVNLQRVRDALVHLPWVEDVSVRRQWPDYLLVRVIEKQPVVYWGEHGVLSSKGKLFVPEKKLNIDLPRLSGPEGQHKAMLKELARLQAWILETGLHIQNMELDDRRSWTLRMSSGMELRLGRKQMHERLNRFVSVYRDNLQSDKREIKQIDMRYTNGFAVAWKEA